MFFPSRHGRRRQSPDSSRGPHTEDKPVRAEALRLAHILVSEFGAEEVYLVDVAKAQSRKRSDIDLAVVGLNPVDYWKASARLSRETNLTVDLVDLSAALPAMIRRVQSEGVLLLTRKSL